MSQQPGLHRSTRENSTRRSPAINTPWRCALTGAEAHNNLGIALAARGKLDVAAALLPTSRSGSPGYPEAQEQPGQFLADQGRLEEAVESYQRAIRIRRDDAKLHKNLGIVLSPPGPARGSRGGLSRGTASPTRLCRCGITTLALHCRGRIGSRRPSPATRRPCVIVPIMPKPITTSAMFSETPGVSPSRSIVTTRR